MSIEKGTRFGLDEVNVPCIYIMRKTLSALEVLIGYKSRGSPCCNAKNFGSMKFKGYNRAIIHHRCICGNYLPLLIERNHSSNFNNFLLKFFCMFLLVKHICQ